MFVLFNQGGYEISAHPFGPKLNNQVLKYNYPNLKS
jgi:hypothetical protein